MTYPAFYTYIDSPFIVGNQVQPIDYYTASGTTASFTLVNKTGLFVGASVQDNQTLFPRATGAITINGNIVTLNSIPAFGHGVLIPGITGLNFTASDHDDSLGRIYETYFYIADSTTIGFYNYEAQPGDPGICVEFYHKLPADISSPTWFQLAPANADGSPGTYLAGGAPLYTSPFNYTDTFQSNQSYPSTTIPVLNASNFHAGDYAMLSFNNPNQEIVKILSIDIVNNLLTVIGFQNPHYTGDTVMACGRKFWAKMTVPLNAAGGLMSVFYGTILRRIVRISPRF